MAYVVSEIVEQNAATLPFGAVQLVVRWMYELTQPARLGQSALERVAEVHPRILEEHPDLLGGDVHQARRGTPLRTGPTTTSR
ncbi:hypothetical protein OG205_07585 [Lentzea sp. NBC_00516]|uniref:hypothetical protein n=1 Tax=Lentzea sp. NBC_00516 TaxID=2903582 RepID=UPI002E815410|nr:hypothetical protein [Lentzea sp. NBC_00516]WUD26845.1 hypothetical protein OG205_07585 [Lentzea sp. NBC_00516]